MFVNVNFTKYILAIPIFLDIPILAAQMICDITRLEDF